MIQGIVLSQTRQVTRSMVDTVDNLQCPGESWVGECARRVQSNCSEVAVENVEGQRLNLSD